MRVLKNPTEFLGIMLACVLYLCGNGVFVDFVYGGRNVLGAWIGDGGVREVGWNWGGGG